jgi:glycosyltransferase involved in cell wall biosynthesis
MKTYNKRIAFLVSYQTLVPYGGIGQFTKSFIDLMETNNIKVDIVTDKKPQDSEFIKSLNATIIYPEDSYAYTAHSGIFMYGDSFCYERMANFRNAVIKSLTTNLYDVIVCNTYETVQVASTMGLEDCIQIIAYTHLESQIFKDTKNPFLHNVNDMMRKQLEVNNITIATQSQFNADSLSIGSYVCPIPLPEQSLLKKYDKPREGVLFIGRWEEGKNPELFLELIEQTKLPARVMTNANGAKKFETKLKALGVDYQIKVGIIGQEKVDFITGCRVAFNPSLVESYGIAFNEQLIQMPTFALEHQRWTKNFAGHFFFETNKKDMAKDVKGAYDMFPTANDWYGKGSLQHAIKLEQMVFYKWKECFESFTPKQSNSNTAKILTHDTVDYTAYIKDLQRGIICIDDVRSALNNKHKYATVVYTAIGTYLSKDAMFQPTEEQTAEDLFEGF